MKTTDWNGRAARLANYINEEMFEAHRGAMLWHDDLDWIIVFGNDGYTAEDDSRAVREVEYVREQLLATENAPRELGFGVNSDGYTWVMLLYRNASADLDETVQWLNDTIWAGWNHACDLNHREHREQIRGEVDAFNHIQGSIAARVIAEHELQRAAA